MRRQANEGLSSQGNWVQDGLLGITRCKQQCGAKACESTKMCKVQRDQVKIGPSHVGSLSVVGRPLPLCLWSGSSHVRREFLSMHKFPRTSSPRGARALGARARTLGHMTISMSMCWLSGIPYRWSDAFIAKILSWCSR